MSKSRLCIVLILFLITLAVGCTPPPEEEVISVTVNIGDSSQVMLVSRDVTVGDVLRELGVEVGELDRVNPSRLARVTNGMIITVVKVREETLVVEEIVPFESRTVLNDTLPAGESTLIQAGENGTEEVTYRIIYENEVEVARNRVRSVLLVPPTDEVVMVGSQAELPTVTVDGTLVYVSNGNAWVIRQNSANRQPLTLDGGVDGRVFDLSADGKRLLFTRSPLQETPAEEAENEQPTPTVEAVAADDIFNTLWVIWDTSDPESKPVELDIQNILYAAWVPETENLIVFSTAEPRDSFPGWQANNDLWRAQVGPGGEIIGAREMLEASAGGVYGWYGTYFAFSPDGSTLAWAQPDSVGVLVPVVEPLPGEETPTPTPTPTPSIPEPEHGLADQYERFTLTTFAPRNVIDLGFVWVPGLTWSPDGTMILSTTHGPALGSEDPEDSPVFNLAALPVSGSYTINLVERAGMWSLAQFSPVQGEDSLEGPVAYLEAIAPLESVTGRYQLVIIDRDGSNRRVLYPNPEDNVPGFKISDLAWQPFTWSPDGRQIAMIYSGNLYLIDTVTGFTQQITGDGMSSNPRWTP